MGRQVRFLGRKYPQRLEGCVKISIVEDYIKIDIIGSRPQEAT